MKRVIEIPKYVYEEVRDKYNHRCDPTVIDDVIVKSTPLNETLDKIIDEIRCRMNMYKVSDFKPNRMKVYALSDVIDIIKKYKESEDEE